MSMSTARGTVKDEAREIGKAQITKSLIIHIKELGFICTDRVEGSNIHNLHLKAIFWDDTMYWRRQSE